MQIKKFTPQDHKIKALIYGPSGAGKTVFTGTADKAIYASAEGGLLSIADKNPDYVEVKSLKDLTDLHSYLLNQKHDYETVVIDSITEINEIIKTQIEKKAGHSMQLQDWGELAKVLRTIFRQFRDLPMNVILVAQEAYITDEDKIRKIVPSLNGKAATEIAYFMDIVGYLNVESDGTRWIETDSNKKLLTKDRSKLIGNKAPIDFKKWISRVKKIETKEQVVKTEYAKPEPTPTSHLLNLKKQLMSRGAKTPEGALITLNYLLKEKFTSLNFTEEQAGKILFRLLQGAKKTTK